MSRIFMLKPGPTPRFTESDWPQIARYFDLHPKATVDDAAKFFSVSKSLMEKTLRAIRDAKEKAPPAETGEPVFQDPLSGAAERNTDRTRSTTMGAPSPKEKSA
jgi:hypothetical protein